MNHKSLTTKKVGRENFEPTRLTHKGFLNVA